MSTAAAIAVDLAVAVLVAGVWIAAGVTARSRPRAALALLATGVALVAGRVATVALLARAGWWFVQEKVLLSLPLLIGTAVVAVVVAAPRLRGRRAGAGSVLALLSVGYAAIGGVAVTVLAGYPATWSIAALVLAAVGAGVVGTARALGVGGLRAPVVACATAGVLGIGLALVAPSTVDYGGAAPPTTATPVSLTDLRGPSTPDSGGTVRRYTLTARTTTLHLDSGRTVEAWTFNGQLPGPALTATQGDLVEVTLVNADITAGVTLHWHGYDVPAGEDGVPGLTQDAVAPGQRFVYRFRAEQTGTYWYHTHEVSDLGVRMGLYGLLTVTPRGVTTAGLDLTLAVHTLDGTLVVGDRDQTDTRTVAPGTPVRLRLLNTDNTPHTFALGGTAFTVVAVDGSDLHGPTPVERTRLRIPGGGRYDVTFPMPGGPVVVGTDRTAPALVLGGPPSTVVPAAAAWPVLDLLGYGTPAATPFGPDSRFDRRFTLVLDRGLAMVDGGPTYAHTVNGYGYPSIATMEVGFGELVELTVVNRSGETHPWHLHGHRVLVLSRDGRAARGSPLWMDTFEVRPGEVWRVAFRADNPGVWMNHCHNLSHADQGMALHLDYAGVSTPFHGGHGG